MPTSTPGRPGKTQSGTSGKHQENARLLLPCAFKARQPERCDDQGQRPQPCRIGQGWLLLQQPYARTKSEELKPQGQWSAFEMAGQMKPMDFFAGQGARRRHSRDYGNDGQRRHAKKCAVSCFGISKADH
jgi:hypothetical protein